MKGIVQNNPANDPDKKPYKSRSRFKPNVSIYQTARFGENTPFYASEVVPDDQNFSLRVNSDVDTLTLKSPVMSPLRMNKDYFFVPLRAILPNNAELLVTNPLTGEDINPKLVNSVIAQTELLKIVGVRQYSNNTANMLLWDALKSVALSSTPDNTSLCAFVGYAFFLYRLSWYVLSEGSLLRNLGYNTHGWFIGPQKKDYHYMSFDEFFEMIFSWISENVSGFDVWLTSPDVNFGTRDDTFHVEPILSNVTDYSGTLLSLRSLLYLLQQGYILTRVENVTLKSGVSLDSVFPVFPSGYSDEFDTATDLWTFNIGVWTSPNHVTRVGPGDDSSTGRDIDLNLSRALAYQLSCVQFYTNDSVDYVYNPHLWHQNQTSLLVGGGVNSSFLQYTLNGVKCYYDSCSGYLLKTAASNLYTYLQPMYFTVAANQWSTTYANPLYYMWYFSNLLSFTRSLKFRDYFVGSKVAPLAVGNVNVTVSSGAFSVVDVTANIMRQRFLNQVNRIGRSLKEYSRGIFGANPSYDPHECVFLGSTTDIIGAEETQNTGEGQRNEFSLTSRMRSESSKFAFEGSFQEFGIVIGILNFDVARPYSFNSDRSIYHVDRFDMFNPYLQTIGDQAVLGVEFHPQQNATNLGYQMRYMEYRQRTDIASGGFLKFLPGYCFLADYRNVVQPGRFNVTIGPDFIRSRSYEFDDLFQVLSNCTPAGYFHFIIRHDCEVQVDRPMLAAPTIL